jgi:hypothetical protein
MRLPAAIVGRLAAAGEGDTVLRTSAGGPRKEKPRAGAGPRTNRDRQCYIAGRPQATPGDYLSRQGAPRMAVNFARLPVAILATMTAAPITSAGRFSPLGPRGMS